MRENFDVLPSLPTGSEHPSFDLTDSRIEVWCVQTAAPANVMRECASLLSADEKHRAARFRFERHREEFLIAHGALRILLARYLHCRAPDLAFAYGRRNKPALPNSGIEFNISHTDGLAVLAFAKGGEIGIDVERIHAVSDMMDIISHFFCRDEAEELSSLPEAERDQAFFLCWTRKEAYIKATGDGLSTPLSDFRVTLKPGEPARFVYVGRGSSGNCGWMLRNVEIAPEYAAAVAWRHKFRRIVQSAVLSASQLLHRCG